MKNILITTLSEFKQLLDNKKDNEKVRIYINDGFHGDVLKITEFRDSFYHNKIDFRYLKQFLH